jgi:hypothetical protein
MSTCRHKLNVAYFNGSLFISALLGAIPKSWAVFWINLAVTFVGAVDAGEVRPQASRR